MGVNRQKKTKGGGKRRRKEGARKNKAMGSMGEKKKGTEEIKNECNKTEAK